MTPYHHNGQGNDQRLLSFVVPTEPPEQHQEAAPEAHREVFRPVSIPHPRCALHHSASSKAPSASLASKCVMAAVMLRRALRTAIATNAWRQRMQDLRWRELSGDEKGNKHAKSRTQGRVLPGSDTYTVDLDDRRAFGRCAVRDGRPSLSTHAVTPRPQRRSRLIEETEFLIIEQ